MISKGRQAKPDDHASPGALNGRAVLTNESVRELRDLYKRGEMMQKQLAARFSVSLPLVQKILAGKLWPYPEAGYAGPLRAAQRGMWHRRGLSR
jgi:hypothetical protein